MSLEKFKEFTKKTIIEDTVTKNVWVYTRVSSKDQEMNKSLETQKSWAYKYAEKEGYSIIETFGGTYESASGDFTRKEFNKLLARVRAVRKKPFAILIYTMSRFSRSGGGGISLAHELVDELGVNLIEISTGKNTITQEGRLEIYRGLITASQENLDRLKVTIPGMIAFSKQGNRLGKA